MNENAGAELRVAGADEALEHLLDRELTEFNDEVTGRRKRTEFSVRVTGPDGETIAGLTGWTWGGLGGIELLWVSEDHRRQGWGSRLLSAAQEEARRRGCDRMIVSTYSFQAPSFYPKHGFLETGRVPGVPGGHEDVYFIKRLE
ncbi:GNAT family N-acetyltransferase [Streptomyces sp. NPDC006879]|uniref:GNAT family N-acetyltransferase n=1 Tax=Streptomyces sp. NPDC006879 TaxID=3364767 RepID=UPI0036B3037D